MTHVILILPGLFAALGIGLALWIWQQHQTRSAASLHSGLRAIDVFLPLPTDGDVLLTGQHGSGITTLTNELVWRFLHASNVRHHVVYVLDNALADLDERITEISELLPMLTSLIVTARVSEFELQNEIDRSANDYLIIIVTTDNCAFLRSARESVGRLKEQRVKRQKRTLIAVSEKLKPNDFDTVICCSSRIAQEGVYPAIDLCASYSLQTNSMLGMKQRVAMHDVASMIREVTREITVGAVAVGAVTVGAVTDPNWIYNHDKEQRPLLQAFCFLSQAYFIAEPFTGKRAARISATKAVAQFTKILSGSLSNMRATSFLYQNSLPVSSPEVATTQSMKNQRSVT